MVDGTLYVIKSFQQNDTDYALCYKIFMKNDEKFNTIYTQILDIQSMKREL